MLSPSQPLYINCQQQPPRLPFMQPNFQSPPPPLPPQQTFPMPMPMPSPHQFQQLPFQHQLQLSQQQYAWYCQQQQRKHTPLSSSLTISPASSGRFDTGYDSDASVGSSSFCGSAGVSPPCNNWQLQTPMGPVPSAASDVWRDTFEARFSQLSIGSWHLKMVSQPPDLANTGFARNLWRYRQERSKGVRFHCSACNTDTLGSGQAVFWIYKDDAANTGHIHLKLYSRKCPSCQSAQSVEPIWPASGAVRALDALYQQVATDYYGGVQAAVKPLKRYRH